MVGMRVSQKTVSEILGSPPLPSLAENAKSGIRPTISKIDIKFEGSETYNFTFNLGGRGKGWAAGLGWTRHTRSKTSLFGFIVGQRTNSKMDITGTQTTDFGTSNVAFSFSEMKGDGLTLMGGLSYRLWSRRQFPIVLGVFVGPFVSFFRSDFYQSMGDQIWSTRDAYSNRVFTGGPMIGAQLDWRFWGLTLNPFIVHYEDITSTCQSFETTSSWAKSYKGDPSCDAGQAQVSGTLTGYGLNVGLLGVSFGLFGDVKPHKTMTGASSVKVKRYSLSYTIDY
jgi:hypothetical protein